MAHAAGEASAVDAGSARVVPQTRRHCPTFSRACCYAHCNMVVPARSPLPRPVSPPLLPTPSPRASTPPGICVVGPEAPALAAQAHPAWCVCLPAFITPQATAAADPAPNPALPPAAPHPQPGKYVSGLEAPAPAGQVSLAWYVSCLHLSPHMPSPLLTAGAAAASLPPAHEMHTMNFMHRWHVGWTIMVSSGGMFSQRRP